MNVIERNQLSKDVKEAARLRGVTEDSVIIEIVATYAPVYINQLKKENE